ncbi:MAG: hypothetical protein Q8K63_03725 [Acidimicrobiales bacterium]|nr:hypothetical protein [Acidimicrobiales bacterium]
MAIALLVFGMLFPGLVALADCHQRSAMRFAGGEKDKSGWMKWLVIALFLYPVGIGYGILLGYHQNVIKRYSGMAAPNVVDDPWDQTVKKPADE